MSLEEKNIFTGEEIMRPQRSELNERVPVSQSLRLIRKRRATPASMFSRSTVME